MHQSELLLLLRYHNRPISQIHLTEISTILSIYGSFALLVF